MQRPVGIGLSLNDKRCDSERRDSEKQDREK